MEEMQADSGQVNFLISLLLRFPQIGTVYYYPVTNLVKIAIFTHEITVDTYNQLEQAIEKHLEVHNRLVGGRLLCSTIVLEKNGVLNRLIIERELDTMFTKDITIIIELIKSYLDEDIIMEKDGTQADLWTDTFDIDEFIISARNEQNKSNLTGIRSHGKVTIYREEQNYYSGS